MNQQMQTGKRIVSKGEYVLRKAFAIWFSIGALACTVILASYFGTFHVYDVRTLTVGKWLLMALQNSPGYVPRLLLCALPLWWGSRRTWKTVCTIQPIHYANTADLPALDSLLRASSEPAQEQKTVLLRAAAETQERHEEQLVRAAGRLE